MNEESKRCVKEQTKIKSGKMRFWTYRLNWFWRHFFSRFLFIIINVLIRFTCIYRCRYEMSACRAIIVGTFFSCVCGYKNTYRWKLKQKIRRITGRIKLRQSQHIEIQKRWKYLTNNYNVWENIFFPNLCTIPSMTWNKQQTTVINPLTNDEMLCKLYLWLKAIGRLPLNWCWHSSAPSIWPSPSATNASGASVHNCRWAGVSPGTRLQMIDDAKLCTIL